MKYYIQPLLLVVLVSVVHSDLPIHCLKSQIEGKWTFHLEEKTKTLSPIQNHCGHSYPDDERTSHLAKRDSFNPISTMRLHLQPNGTVIGLPTRLAAMLRFKQTPDYKMELQEMKKMNTALKNQRLRKEDQESFMALIKRVSPQNRFYDNIWTMIYDEGFEINHEHQRLFMYSRYYPDPSNSTNMLSDCSSTLVGWFHDYLTGELTCVRGIKDTPLPKQARFSESSFESQSQGPYLPGDYQDHQAMADKLNALGLSWESGVSPDFQGMTLDEMHSMAGRKSSLRSFQQYSFKTTSQGYYKPLQEDLTDLPSDFSWEDALGKVKNQGRCGSCYIFAFLEMMHARLRILHGIDTELSYQHAMDCMFYNQGCQGGFPSLVAKFGNEVGFVPLSCKAYTAKKGECSNICAVDQLQQIYKVGEYGYVNGVYGQVSQRSIMEEIIKHGPISVSLDVDYSFMIYKSGVYSRLPAQWVAKGEPRPQWSKLAHSVVCFGWGVDQNTGKKYWLIRNSWGEKWGEKGHMKIERGQDILGVESSPEYAMPIVVDLEQSPQERAHLSFYK